MTFRKYELVTNKQAAPTDYGHPMRAFFKYPNILADGQIGRIGCKVFLVELSAQILSLCIPSP